MHDFCVNAIPADPYLHWIYRMASYFLLNQALPLGIPNFLHQGWYKYFLEPGYKMLMKVF